jgi:hypothetical protein
VRLGHRRGERERLPVLRGGRRQVGHSFAYHAEVVMRLGQPGILSGRPLRIWPSASSVRFARSSATPSSTRSTAGEAGDGARFRGLRGLLRRAGRASLKSARPARRLRERSRLDLN